MHITLHWRQEQYAAVFDVSTGKMLSEIIDDSDESDGIPLHEISAELVTRIFSQLPHFQGCDFTDATFLSNQAAAYLQPDT